MTGGSCGGGDGSALGTMLLHGEYRALDHSTHGKLSPPFDQEQVGTISNPLMVSPSYAATSSHFPYPLNLEPLELEDMDDSSCTPGQVQDSASHRPQRNLPTSKQ